MGGRDAPEIPARAFIVDPVDIKSAMLLKTFPVDIPDAILLGPMDSQGTEGNLDSRKSTVLVEAAEAYATLLTPQWRYSVDTGQWTDRGSGWEAWKRKSQPSMWTPVQLRSPNEVRARAVTVVLGVENWNGVRLHDPKCEHA